MKQKLTFLTNLLTNIFKNITKKFPFYTALFIVIWLYAVTFNDFDFDLWARLAVGKIFFQLGHVIKNDIFSYTETKPVWIDHEWGSGVIFYFLTDHFGDIGLLLLKITGSFLILFLISKIIQLYNSKNNHHLNLLWYITIILAIFNGISATVRSQLFTFIFFTLWIYVLERVRRGENRLLWIIPATTLIWANLHGGFVAGLGLVGIYGVGELLNRKPFKKYFLILIPSVLITLINPYGIDYWEYIVSAITMQRSTIAEWMPTQLFGPLMQWRWFKLLLLLSLISLFVSLVMNKFKYRNLDKVKCLLVLITLCMAIKHIKHQPFFAITAGSFFYHDFYTIFGFIFSKFGERTRKLLNNLALIKDILIYTAIILIGSIMICFKPFVVTLPENKYPVGSIEFIRKNSLKGNISVPFHWGSYAAWSLYPDCLISIDGRYEEVYPEIIDTLTANFDYAVDESWYDFLKKYHTDILLLDKHLPSYQAILNTPFWKKIYGDKISAVFVPINTVQKSYVIPIIREEEIIKKKYNSLINFLE